MIQFTTFDGHQDRYLQALSQLDNHMWVNPEWGATLFLLTAHEGVWSRVARHVDFRRRLISWDRIRRIPLSCAERFLVDLAQQLYSGGGRIDLAPLWETCDDSNFRLCVQALQLRYHGLELLQFDRTA